MEVRLVKLANEYNTGIVHLADFLNSKGFGPIHASPAAKVNITDKLRKVLDKHYSQKAVTIKEIEEAKIEQNISMRHKEIKDFILTTFPLLYFIIETDEAIIKEKQTVFLGTNDFLCLSFWKSYENEDRLPSIYLSIPFYNNEKPCLKIISSQKEKIELLEPLEDILSMEKSVDGYKMILEKHYRNVDTEAFIKNFIENDKKKIDAYLKAIDKDGKYFPAVTKSWFDKHLQTINKHRSNRIEIIEKDKINSIKIEEVELINIKNFVNLDINFGKKLTCLIGDNGTGKTTILHSLTAALVANVTNMLIDDSLVRVQKTGKDNEEEASILAIMTQNKKTYFYASLLFETKPPLYKTNIEFDTSVFSFAQENGLLNQLFIAFSQQTQKKDKRRDSRSKIRQPNIDDVSSFLMGEPDTRFDDVLDWLAAAMDTNTSLDERDATLPVIQKVLEVIGEITNTPMQLVVETNARSEVKVEFTATGQRMPLRFLSQGFNNVIGWVGFFMKRLWEAWESCKTLKSKHFFEHPALCLIDEIDTYLHPKWQRTILNVLIKHFPNTQWVVTTHSPLVIGNLDYPNTEDIFIYNINLDGTATMLPNAFGKDNNHLNYAYFGVPFRNEKMQKNLDDLFEMIESEETEAANLLLTQLVAQLGNDDPDIVRAQILLNF